MPWSTALKSPVPLPGRGQLKTLSDVWSYILKLPKSKQDSEAWLTVAEALLNAVNHGGPWLDFVRIATMQALTDPKSMSEPNHAEAIHLARRKLARGRWPTPKFSPR